VQKERAERAILHNNSEPACPYLSKGGLCKFNPTEQNSKSSNEWDDNGGQIKTFSILEKRHILEVNNNKCYIASWNQKNKV
jgi:hypothetical protein